jgi:hypothetical protein
MPTVCTVDCWTKQTALSPADLESMWHLGVGQMFRKAVSRTVGRAGGKTKWAGRIALRNLEYRTSVSPSYLIVSPKACN